MVGLQRHLRVEQDGAPQDLGTQQQQGRPDVGAVREPHGDYVVGIEPVFGGGRQHEVAERVRPGDEVGHVEHALGEAPEEARHPALDHVAARAQQAGAGQQHVAERDEIVFVAARAVEEQERRQPRHRRTLEAVDERHGHSVLAAGPVTLLDVPPPRRILHIDMDAFFASVEQLERPELRGQPVAVGGDPNGRGVVAAASYEARTFGVRSAIPMARAVRLCPHLVIVRPNFARYQAISKQIFALYRDVTPLVEPLSIDEAYLDVTENAWGEPLGMRVAQRLKAAIREATGLTASAGVAPNKFLAKIASGWKKPDGLTVIAPERVESFLQQLPVDALLGVGPVTAAKLQAIGITQLVDVRSADPDQLTRTIGSHAEWLRQLAQGIDTRPVQPHRESKSSGMERTFAHDLGDRAEIVGQIERMADAGAAWLERHALFARTVTLKVRYGDFTTITRSHTREPATRDAAVIRARAIALLDRTEAGSRPVRLLGVSVHNLSDGTAPEPIGRTDLPRLPFEAP